VNLGKVRRDENALWSFAPHDLSVILHLLDMEPLDVVARGSDVKIRVYSATGQLVRVLVDARREPGQYSTSWDCRDSRGRQVSSGVYFCKMEAGSYKAIRKMLVVK
jgi:hypothetical protein